MAEDRIDANEWINEFRDFNKELEERILAANQDSSGIKWNKLLPDIMGADVFMAGQFDDETRAKGQFNILMMQKDGHTVVPFFTSPDKLSVLVNPQNSQFDVMKVNTVRFFQSIKGRSAIMNPLSPYSRLFSPFEMNILVAENLDKAPPLPDADQNNV